MKKSFWILILSPVFMSFGFNGLSFASDLPISGAGKKLTETNQTYSLTQTVNTYPNYYWNGPGWVYKQKSKVNYKRKGQENFQSDNFYTDSLGNKIYIQNSTIYNISPYYPYGVINGIYSNRSKSVYSYENGK